MKKCVQVNSDLVKLLKENKAKTGINIDKFVEIAVIEKLQRDKEVRKMTNLPSKMSDLELQ